MDVLLNWVWQGSVVAFACFVMLRVLERARANVRYVVCWAALLLIVVLPALPSLSSMAPPADAFPVTQSDPIVSLPHAWWTSPRVMLALWMTWTAVGTLRFASAMVALRRARARSRAFPSHVASHLPHWSRARHGGRHAPLVLSDSVSMAAVLGGGTPMIAVAPSLLTTLDTGQLDRVLIHEWAHVQRRDDLGHILQIVIRTLAGWHPAIWWVDHRLQIEREIACDEITVGITGSPKSYAQCLMTLASLKHTARAMTAAPAVLMVSGLRTRLTKILSPLPWIAPGRSRTIAVAIVSALCMLSAGVGGVKLVEATKFVPRATAPPRESLGPRLNTMAPISAPTQSTPVNKPRARRQPPVSAPSAQRPPAKESVTPAVPEPDPASTTATTSSVDTVPAAEPAGGQPILSESATAVPPPAAQPPEVKVEPPRSPWGAAADSGVAVGRNSKQAGVATAGFFTRIARRVAGSF